MVYIGIDIGSTAAKTLVFDGAEIITFFVLPTGWSSKETASGIRAKLLEDGFDVDSPGTKIIATGYGRVSVDYADAVLTEITCHGKGGSALMNGDCVIIDVGGQDTKIINVENGAVTGFLMNDKCSAGTGKFIEIMANRMGIDIGELFSLAQKGNPVSISSMCTVFAESEVISQIAAGKSKEDMAAGIVESVVSKVGHLAARHNTTDKYILTGGLSMNPFFSLRLSEKMGQNIFTHEMGKYAGAFGAALLAADKFRQPAAD